jgi:predicted dehydrogenase
MKPMRLGIIGPGLIWQFKHRPVLSKLNSDFAVAAFCASSDRHKADAARDYPGVPFVTDLDAFVQRDDMDAVVVLTPIPLNGPVALAALKAGKDVFLEKPMAHRPVGARTGCLHPSLAASARRGVVRRDRRAGGV